MTTPFADETDHASPPCGRSAGVVIVLASILSAASAANHPTSQSRDAAGFVIEMVQKARMDKLVHGALIVVAGGMFYGFSCLASRLGERSPWARAGLIAYAIGTMAIVGAASIDGFILPDFVTRYQGRPTIELGMLKQIVTLCGVTIRVWGRMAAMATSLAYVLWSIELIRRPGAVRATGIFGCIVGGLLIVGVLTGVVPMNTHGVLVLFVVQGVWNITVGVQLIQGRI